jgi:hypothetical protein
LFACARRRKIAFYISKDAGAGAQMRRTFNLMAFGRECKFKGDTNVWKKGSAFSIPEILHNNKCGVIEKEQLFLFKNTSNFLRVG